MAFQMPTIKELVERTRQGFRAELPSTDAWLWPSFLHVVSKVFGGIVWSVFGRLKWIDEQRFALTASGYELERHGIEIGVYRKTSAFSTGWVSLTGTPGATISAGATLTRSDDVTYTTQADVTLSAAGGASVLVACTSTGVKGNAVFGTSLTGTGDVASATVLSSGLAGGSTQETDEELRARILFRKRNPPQGGALTDYIIWATEVPGVTRAFVDTNPACGAGIVIVYPMLDSENAGNYGLPTAADIAAVQAHIRSVAPVTARVIVMSPTLYAFNVIVKGLTPNTNTNRENAAKEVYATVYNNAEVTTAAAVNTIYRSWIWQAVASVVGQQHFEITQPAIDLIIPAGAIPVVGNVLFTE